MPKVPVDVLVSIEKDGEDLVVGGQRDATLNRDVETIDATHKLTAGWANNIAGQGSWGIETDLLILEDDESYNALEDAFENKEEVNVTFTNPSGTTYKGSAIITSFPVNAPMNDVMSSSVTFAGQGKYEKERSNTP